MKYNAATRRYFEAAPGAGALQGPGTLRGTAGDRAQGTWVQFDVELNSAGPVPIIQAARFAAFGCPHTIAVCARIVEEAVGCAPDPARSIDLDALRERFGVPVEKLGRLLIIEDAWSAMLRSS